MTTYRVGNHQPQNLYRGDTYIGVMFNPIDAAAIVRHLNRIEECDCASYEPCHGECCGVGMCSCSATPEDIAKAGEGLGFKVQCPTWGCRAERGHDGDCNVAAGTEEGLGLDHGHEHAPGTPPHSHGQSHGQRRQP